MKTLNKVLLIMVTMTSMNTFAAGGVSRNAGASVKHSAAAISHGTVAIAQVGSAVIATPLIVVGAIGTVSLEAGTALMENAINNEPLEISEKTVTAAPSPAQMMKTNTKEKL